MGESTRSSVNLSAESADNTTTMFLARADPSASRSNRAGGQTAIAVLLFALAYGVVAQGGYRRSQFVPFAALLAPAILLSLPRLARDRRIVATLIGAPALAACPVLLGAAISDSWQAALPTLGAIGACTGAIVIGAGVSERHRSAVVGATVGLGMVIAVTAWLGVVLRRAPWGLVADGLWRGSSLLTYANSSAALLSVTALVTAAWAMRAARPLPLLGCLAVLLGGIATTQSRGGAVALTVGFVVLAAQHRRRLAVLIPALAGGLVIGLGVVLSADANGPANVALACGSVVAGVVVVPLLQHLRTRQRARHVVAAALLLGGAVALLTTDLAPLVRSRVTLASARHGGEEGHTYLFGDRAPAWRVAWNEVGEHPLTGVGPGNLELRWVAETGETQAGRFVHNEWLEWLATYGVVGAAGLAGALGLIGWATRRARADPALSGLAAACAAFAVHSAVDFLWRQPVLPVTLALLVGLARFPLDESPAATRSVPASASNDVRRPPEQDPEAARESVPYGSPRPETRPPVYR